MGIMINYIRILSTHCSDEQNVARERSRDFLLLYCISNDQKNSKPRVLTMLLCSNAGHELPTYLLERNPDGPISASNVLQTVLRSEERVEGRLMGCVVTTKGEQVKMQK